MLYHQFDVETNLVVEDVIAVDAALVDARTEGERVGLSRRVYV
jgi:hypothetical protein